MKLTKAQRLQLSRALEAAEDAWRYITGDSIAVCRRGPATTALHYVRATRKDVEECQDGLYEVERSYGSPLCRLTDTIETLRQILDLPPT